MIYLFFEVNKDEIHLIKFIVEAYDNIMQVSTVDETLPKIQISIAPDLIDDAKTIIAELATRHKMIPIPDDPHVSQGNL